MLNILVVEKHTSSSFLGRFFNSIYIVFLVYTPRTNVISGDESDSGIDGMKSMADLGGKFQMVSPKPSKKF